MQTQFTVQSKIHADKVSLIEKLDIMRVLEDNILEHMRDPEDMEEQIDKAGEVRHRMRACITSFESYMEVNVRHAVKPPTFATKTK